MIFRFVSYVQWKSEGQKKRKQTYRGVSSLYLLHGREKRALLNCVQWSEFTRVRPTRRRAKVSGLILPHPEKREWRARTHTHIHTYTHTHAHTYTHTHTHTQTHTHTHTHTHLATPHRTLRFGTFTQMTQRQHFDATSGMGWTSFLVLSAGCHVNLAPARQNL